MKLDFIPKEDVLERMENNEPFKLVEVLSRDEYEECHLPGAISLPLEEIESKAGQVLDKREDVVVYCGSYACHASTNAARKLMEMGFENVHDYKGGKSDWQKAGLPMEP